MSDLESKFNTFEEQVATQHTALITSLTATNDKLDTLISLFGGAPPTATTTLEDVLTAIQAGNVLLDDVHADTMSMDTKLLTMRNTLTDVHADTMSMDAKLLIMRNTLTALYNMLYDSNPILGQIYSSIGLAVGSTLSALLTSSSSIATSNTALSAVLGSPADDTQSILRWLVDIAACACRDPNAIPVLEDCTDPFTSTGMFLTPFEFVGFENVTSAVWSAPLPAGISFGTTFGIGVDDTELYSDDWAGWRIYVQSSGYNYAYSPTTADRLPTNTWQAMPAGAASYSFAVRGIDSIKVILCPTPTVPFVIEIVDSSACVVMHNLYEQTGGGTKTWAGTLPGNARVLRIGAAGDGNFVTGTINGTAIEGWTGYLVGDTKFYRVYGGESVSFTVAGGDYAHFMYCSDS
jgi:hypothetical protein